jgi:cation:H+ antiporter
VSPGSLLLVVGHLAGTRAIHRYVAQRGDASATARPPAGAEAASRARLRRAGVRLSLAALVLLGAAPVFSASAREIAEQTGLGDVFVGTWLVGLATSLPEVVTCVAAVRIGALDLAVGNLFGSNAFNMVIFLALDLAQPGSLFAALDPSHALSGLFAVLLMSLGLAAIVYRAQRRFAMIEPGSVLMLVTYVAAIWVLYRHSLAGR